MKKLTIGMPVYNGAATIRAALDSLLAQTMDDFQIIISDNGSSDETQSICEAYAARDPRISYIRQAKNLGPQMNFRFVLYEAHTPFFMWAAADDLWATTFAERNIAALDDDLSLVMSQSKVLFTVNGAPSHMAFGTYKLDLEDVRLNAAGFFQNPADNSRYYGVFRTEALKAVFPTRPFFALDWLVSAATLRHGKHRELRETLMIRDSSDPATYARAVLSDHRFILWRIFPLLFMTRWLISRRSVPLTWPVLYRLYRLNVYLHFRFGALKFKRIAERYLKTNSLRDALGLRRTPRVPATANPPPPPPQRPPGPDIVVPIGPALVVDRWSFPVPPPAEPRLSVVIIADSGMVDAFRAVLTAQRLALTAPVEVIFVPPRSDHFHAGSFEAIEGIIVAEVEGEPTVGRMMNVGLARATAANVLLVRAQAWYDPAILAALEEALVQAPLVAPQILYPDGKLAAAGGVVSAGGGFWRYGRLEAPDASKFDFARGCDFACLALGLRRNALEGQEPFDAELRHFDVAVADYCLRERARLGAPLYWPWARLACEDDNWRELTPEATLPPLAWSEDLSRLHDRNRRMIGHLAALEGEGRPAHDHAHPRRLLYVDATTPRPDENAGSIEVMSQLKVFTDFGFRVTFIPESSFAHDGRYTEALQKMGVEAIYWPHGTSVHQELEASRDAFDVVVLCRAYIAERYVPMVRAVAPRAKVIFYTVDLHFLREEREAQMSGDAVQMKAAENSRLTELATVNAVDATIVHSTMEQELLIRAAPGARIQLLPLMRAVPQHLSAPGPEGRRDILFVGTYQHPPNADAATFFAREVWPLVRPRLPDARFLAVGSAVTPQVLALAGDGVDVLGFVRDLEPILNSARMSVAPLRFGAGLKGKVATTLQAGLPTIATSVAAEGVALRDGHDILIADTAQDMADAVVRLYNDDILWDALSRNGFAFARAEFSFEANMKRLAALFADLGTGTQESERVLLEADLASGETVFRAHKSEGEAQAEHAARISGDRLMTFKRRIGSRCGQRIPGTFEDPRLKSVMSAFHERPSLLPIEIAATVQPELLLDSGIKGHQDFNPFANPDDARFYAFYAGLVWYVMTLHAGDDLHLRLTEPSLGASIALRQNDRAISPDLAVSLLEYSRIRQITSALTLPERTTYLDLGAGYGRLAYVMLSAGPCRYIIVDSPANILLAKWYLPAVLPRLKVFGYRHFTRFQDVWSEIHDADLIFLSPNQLALLPDGFVDVSISIASLHAMNPAQILRYMELIEAKTSSAIYLKQWGKWRNPENGIEFCAADHQLQPPWRLVHDGADIIDQQFVEFGWHRGRGD